MGEDISGAHPGMAELLRDAQPDALVASTPGGVTQDITSRVDTEAALRESEQRYRLLFENAGEAIYVVEAEGERVGAMVEANAAAARMHGYTVAELLTLNVAALLPPDQAKTTAGGVRGVHAQGWKSGEVVHVRRDGTPFPAEYTAGPLEVRGKRCILVFLRDVTAHRHALEDLQRAKELAESAGRELEAFSYSVAHDLRAPLRAIDGFSHILLDEHAAQLDPEGRHFLKSVRASAQHMAHLIDDLLTLAHVTRSELRREDVDLGALAHAAAARLREREPAREVELVVAEGLHAVGDRRLLGIALDNLLANAWKFTGKRPRARVEVGVLPGAGVAVHFVRDDGAGFDMAYAAKLFGVFQRLHTPAEFEGTGIGLATVQRIVLRHGGRIWAEGAVDRGATVYFTLESTRETP